MKKNMIRRAAGLLIFEVSNANPNGDPDNEGEPRRRVSDRRGFVTAVSLKRKLRDMLENHDSDTFQAIVQSLKLNPDRFHILESRLRGFASETSDPSEACALAFDFVKKDKAAFVNKYFDVRTFGTTFLEENKTKNKAKKKEKETEVAESTSATFKSTGPVTFCVGESVEPIEIQLDSITKKFPLRDGLVSREQGDMAPGALKFVRHGIYAVKIGVCANLGNITSTTQEDIEVLKYMLPHIFKNSSSCSRPAGSINVLRCYWAEHEDSPVGNSFGSFNEYDFWSALTPRFIGTGESKSVDQYEFPNMFNGVQITDLAAVPAALHQAA